MSVEVGKEDGSNLQTSDKIGFPAADPNGVQPCLRDRAREGVITEGGEIFFALPRIRCPLNAHKGDRVGLGLDEKVVSCQGRPELVRVGGIGCAAGRSVHRHIGKKRHLQRYRDRVVRPDGERDEAKEHYENETFRHGCWQSIARFLAVVWRSHQAAWL